MPIQKVSAQNNGWTKKEAKIFRRNYVISRTLAGLESAIVAKRHLLSIDSVFSLGNLFLIKI